MSHDEFKKLLDHLGVHYESTVSFGQMLGLKVRGSACIAKETVSKIQTIAPCTSSETQDDLTTIWTFPKQVYHRPMG